MRRFVPMSQQHVGSPDSGAQQPSKRTIESAAQWWMKTGIGDAARTANSWPDTGAAARQRVRPAPLARCDAMKPPFEKPLTKIASATTGSSARAAWTDASMKPTSSRRRSRAGPQQCGALNEWPMPCGASSAIPNLSAAASNFAISSSAVQPKQWTSTSSGIGRSQRRAGGRIRYSRCTEGPPLTLAHGEKLRESSVCRAVAPHSSEDIRLNELNCLSL